MSKRGTIRGLEPEELADAITRLTKWAQEHAPEPEPDIRRRLRGHFGRDPGELTNTLLGARQPED